MATSTEVSDRLARLATWKPGGGRTVAPEDRLPIYLLVAGSICMPLGLVIVLLGWYGAAHTPFGFEQVPYLISGGLLGLGVIFAGGFLFFGSWVARIAVTSQRTADQMARLTERIEGLAEGGAHSDAGNGAAVRAPRPRSRLVATAAGTMLHRADCPIVAGRDNVREVSAKEQAELKPCQICNPLD